MVPNENSIVNRDLNQKIEVDRIASEFERKLQSGLKPLIQDYFAQRPCDALLVELIAIESELAESLGNPRTRSEYVEMFPSFPEVIESFFDSRTGDSVSAKPNISSAQPHDLFGFSPTPPFAFGKFEVLEEISRGGMAVVYRAKQVSPSRIVALKVLSNRYLDTDSWIARFKKEANAIAILEHPNIVPVYECGEFDSNHYLAMQYVDGENLRERCRENPLPPDFAVRVICDAAHAISFAHSRGVLHRDIKAENILIDQNDRVRLVDFGLASHESVDQSLTSEGDILGTPYCMPPEQTTGDVSKIDERSDVYSLGATLYLALTGRPVFQGRSIHETFAMIQNDTPMAPSDLNPKVTRRIDKACLKCLEKEPGSRFQSASKLALALKDCLENQEIPEPRPSLTTGLIQGVASKQRWKLLMVGLGIAGLILVGLAVSKFWSDNSTDLRQRSHPSANEVTEILTDLGYPQAFHAGCLHLRSRRFQKAEQSFDQLRESDPAYCLIGYGCLQAYQGNYVEALNFLQQAEELNVPPRAKWTLYYQSQDCLLRLGRIRDSKRYANLTLDLDATSADHQRHRFNAFVLLNDQDSADKEVKKAIGLGGSKEYYLRRYKEKRWEPNWLNENKE